MALIMWVKRKNMSSQVAPNIKRDELLLEHLPWIKSVAGYVYQRIYRRTEIDDLIQAGVVAFLEVIPKFKKSKKILLKTFAGKRIIGAMFDCHEKNQNLPRNIVRKLTKKGDSKQDIISRFIPIEELSEEQEVLFIDKTQSPFLIVEQKELIEMIKKLTSSLPSTPHDAISYKELIYLHYEKELRAREIANQFKVHETRVCQIKKKMLLTLKNEIKEKYKDYIK